MLTTIYGQTRELLHDRVQKNNCCNRAFHYSSCGVMKRTDLLEVAFLCSFYQTLEDAFLVDVAHAMCRNFEVNPFVQFRNIEFLCMQIGLESSFRFDIGVGNVISDHCFFSCNLTNS